MKNLPAPKTPVTGAGQSYTPDWSKYQPIESNEECREAAAVIVHQVIESASSSIVKSHNGGDAYGKDDGENSVLSTSTDTPPPLNNLSDHSGDDTSQSDLSFPPPPPEVLQECHEIADDILKNGNNAQQTISPADKPKLADFHLDSVSSHDLTYDETSSVTSPVADELTFALDLSSSLNQSKGSEEGFEHPEAWTNEATSCGEHKPDASTGAIQKTSAARLHCSESTDQACYDGHVADHITPLEDLTSPDLTLSASGSEDELPEAASINNPFNNSCEAAACNVVPDEELKLKVDPQTNGQCLDEDPSDTLKEEDQSRITTVISNGSAGNEGEVCNVDSDPAQVIGQAETSRSSESDVTSANTDVLMTYDSSSGAGEIEINVSKTETETQSKGATDDESDLKNEGEESAGQRRLSKLTDSAKDTSIEDEVFAGEDEMNDELRNVDDEDDLLPKNAEPGSADENISGSCEAKNFSDEIDSEGDVEYSGLEAMELKRKLEGQDSTEVVSNVVWDYDFKMDPSESNINEETHSNENDEGVHFDDSPEEEVKLSKSDLARASEKSPDHKNSEIVDSNEQNPSVRSENSTAESENLADDTEKLPDKTGKSTDENEKLSDETENLAGENEKLAVDCEKEDDLGQDGGDSDDVRLVGNPTNVIEVEVELVGGNCDDSESLSPETEEIVEKPPLEISNELRKLAEEIVRIAIEDAKERIKKVKPEEKDETRVSQPKTKEKISSSPEKEEIPIVEPSKNVRKPWYRRAGITLRNLCSCGGTWSKESESDCSK